MGSLQLNKKSAPSEAKIQQRIHHFFTVYANRTGKTLEEIGSDLNVSKEAISKYKASEKNRVLSSYFTLQKIAQLEEMSAGEFCNYLENSAPQGEKLFPWQKIILQEFGKISHVYREQFIHRYLANSSPEELAKSIELFLWIGKLGKKEQQILESLFESWKISK
jgi:transcriptional regulator with XRE-family HTH domain